MQMCEMCLRWLDADKVRKENEMSKKKKKRVNCDSLAYGKVTMLLFVCYYNGNQKRFCEKYCNTFESMQKLKHTKHKDRERKYTQNLQKKSGNEQRKKEVKYDNGKRMAKENGQTMKSKL